jgi:hypothetical protein
MAKSEREAAQRKRAEARERRRKQSPEEQTDQADSSPSGDGDSLEEPLATVKQAAKVAAAGAAVGAAAAAARALGKHDEGAEEQQSERGDPAPVETEEPKGEESEQREPEPDPEPRPQEESRPEPRASRSEPQDERAPGASPDEARNAVRQAQEQLETLLGRDPESVSAMERTHDGWLVTVEVVEVSRIPESTDVLASYEIELDESCNLRRYARVRRYNRSQADHGGGE